MSEYKFDCGCSFPVFDEKIKPNDMLPSMEINYDNLNYNCVSTWDLFSRGQTKGVFQLEKNLGKHWSKKVQPTSIEDISALVSLIRPGVLNFKVDGKNMAQHYVDRKFNLEETTYIHPALEKILNDTFSILTYQEQAIRIASEIAGFNLQQADTLRKAAGKKDSKLMQSLKSDFITGCINTGLVNEEVANILFDNIEKSNRYSFNKCISGNEKLFRNKSKSKYTPTIEEMYKIKNDKEYAKSIGKTQLHKKYKLFGYGKTLSIQDGRLKLNNIVDIRYAGFRPVYEVTLSNGSKIETTSNHKYPTKNGEKPLDKLKVGDILFVKGEYEVCTNKYNWSDISKNNINHKKYDGQGFPSGKSNPAYTNGSYSEFEKNKIKLSKNCYDCGNLHKRMEVHHIDGNRTNSSLANLVNLCPSCHKKREYKVGRVRKGEKGYPILEFPIVSIKLVGEKNVYDVEMQAPYHNFVVDSGIVTCNSHGISYGETSYWTAYAKTHFPLHFCCSYLHYAREKMKPQEEIDEIICDSKELDVDILTPDIRYLFNGDPGDFAINNLKINFGIRSIKGCGDKNIGKLLEIVTLAEKTIQKPIHEWSWLELLLLVLTQMTKTVVNGLISVGGCSHFGISRQKMLHEYSVAAYFKKEEIELILKHLDRLNTLEECLDYLISCQNKKVRKESLLNLKKTLSNPPFSLEDTALWIAEKEKFYLGSPISCLKVDTVSLTGDTTCQEYKNGKEAKKMTLVGEIKSTREFILKNGAMAGNKICFATLEDNSGRVDIVMSVEKYEEYRNLCYQGNIVMVTGKRSKNNDNFQVERMVIA